MTKSDVRKIYFTAVNKWCQAMHGTLHYESTQVLLILLPFDLFIMDLLIPIHAKISTKIDDRAFVCVTSSRDTVHQHTFAFNDVQYRLENKQWSLKELITILVTSNGA